MPRYLVITIDTEIDSPKWQPEYPYTLKNIKAIPKLQVLFKKYRVEPTYLITYPVAQDEESVKILTRALEAGAEIGAHLHPWTTPPFFSEEERFKLSYPHFSDLEKEKLVNLTRTIERGFRKPLSYRAGRYGFDEDSLRILEELGYKVDSSVTPTMNWSSDGGSDFSEVESPKPYYLNSILEVPISIVVNRKFLGYNKLSPIFKAILKKMSLVKTLWLRPSISSLEEMKYISDILLEKVNILNMMFHSNELMPGTSPYIKTPKKSEEFFQKLDQILDYLINSKKLEIKTLAELPLIFSI